MTDIEQVAKNDPQTSEEFAAFEICGEKTKCYGESVRHRAYQVCFNSSSTRVGAKNDPTHPSLENCQSTDSLLKDETHNSTVKRNYPLKDEKKKEPHIP